MFDFAKVSRQPEGSNRATNMFMIAARSFGIALRMKRKLLVGLGLVAVGFGCQKAMQPPADVIAWRPPPVTPSQPAASAAPQPSKYGRLSRTRFNELAVRLNLPLYWVGDLNSNGAVDPGEVKTLLFYPTSTHWTKNDAFTSEFKDAYASLVAADAPIKGRDEDETHTMNELAEELAQGAPTLIANDLTKLTAAEKNFVGHILQTASHIDTLFGKMMGTQALATSVADAPAINKSVFRRNWSPKCSAPKTGRHPKCNAIAEDVKEVSDLYPAKMQKEREFCKKLEKLKRKDLLDPFAVVREEKGKLAPVPYQVAYKAEMNDVAKELDLAARALDGVPSEKAMRTYLLAAAHGFRTNDWLAADEAWSKMNALNSRFYLRVAPDEVYWEPCAHKAGFHLTFALINKASLSWQDKLTPIQQEMEDNLALRIGDPYDARKVTFHLPDFIDIVINAGDDREPIGATIGQSLPNWGPVTAEGRGRTVAMSNLYTDADSKQNRKTQAYSLISADAMKVFGDTDAPGLLSTILHEATHNLGPAHDYKYKGQTASDAFGGALASMMEELKAQTGGLYYVDMLLKKGIVDEKAALATYLDSIIWAFGHISREMYDANHKPQPYSHLAAIQIGFLMEHGAIAFSPTLQAANGKDVGAFTIAFEKLPVAIEKLMREVGRAKAENRRGASEAWVKRYVDSDLIPQAIIRDRFQRLPRASFVYAVDL